MSYGGMGRTPTLTMLINSVLMLFSLLIVEVAYYNSNLFALLDQALPPNVKAWMLLLTLPFTLGFVNGLHLLKYMRQQMGSASKPTRGTA